MKNIILGLFALSLTLFSCQQQTSVEEAFMATKQIEKQSVAEDLTFNFNSLDDIKWRTFTGTICKGTSGNCFPDVGFRQGDSINDILNLINDGTKRQIQIAFLENKTTLQKMIPVQAVENVIQGSFTVANEWNIEKQTNFVLFYNQKNSLVLVTPFKLEENK